MTNLIFLTLKIIITKYIYVADEINLWSFTIGKDFAIRNSLFGTVTFSKNADFDKYKYSGFWYWT